MKVALLGDVAFFGRKCIVADPQLSNKLSAISAYLGEHDIVVANLEAPFIDGHRAVGAKSAHVASNMSNVKLLKKLGVTHVTLANNHIMDYGCDAFALTKSLLDVEGISYFGVNSQGIRLEHHGNKIALLGFCSYNTNPSDISCGAGGGINVSDVEEIEFQLKDAREAGYLSILAAHSGQEHVHMPSRDDIVLARGLARQGSYIYYGHHPHVVQGYEQVSDAHIFYSLGNFLFDDVYTTKSPEPLIKMSDANRTGLIVSLEISRNRVVNQECIPIYNGDDDFIFGSDVKGFSMETYNNFLKLPEVEYSDLRRSHIERFIGARKAKRDLNWYIARMRPSSVMMIVNARRNARLYRKHFASKIQILSTSDESKSTS